MAAPPGDYVGRTLRSRSHPEARPGAPAAASMYDVLARFHKTPAQQIIDETIGSASRPLMPKKVRDLGPADRRRPAVRIPGANEQAENGESVAANALRRGSRSREAIEEAEKEAVRVREQRPVFGRQISCYAVHRRAVPIRGAGKGIAPTLALQPRKSFPLTRCASHFRRFAAAQATREFPRGESASTSRA